MIRRRYLISALHALILFIWPPGVALAASVMGDGVADVSLALAGVALMLSTLSGVTALLWRLEREMRAQPTHALPRPLLLVGSHMACSWLAGALAFALCEAQDLNEWWEVAAVIAASFSGATFVQAAAERLLGKLIPPVPGYYPPMPDQGGYTHLTARQRPRRNPYRMKGGQADNAQPARTAIPPAYEPESDPVGEVFETVPGALAPLHPDDEEP